MKRLKFTVGFCCHQFIVSFELFISHWRVFPIHFQSRFLDLRFPLKFCDFLSKFAQVSILRHTPRLTHVLDFLFAVALHCWNRTKSSRLKWISLYYSIFSFDFSLDRFMTRINKSSHWPKMHMFSFSRF